MIYKNAILITEDLKKNKTKLEEVLNTEGNNILVSFSDIQQCLPKNQNRIIKVPLSAGIKQYCHKYLIIEAILFLAICEAYRCEKAILYYNTNTLSSQTYDNESFVKKLQILINAGTQYSPIISLQQINNIDQNNIKRKDKDIKPLINEKRCAILFSGGIDCTVALYLMRKLSYEITLISFLYGQLNSEDEERCIEYIKRKYNYVPEYFNLKDFYHSIRFSSDLLKKESELIMKEESREYVPLRNTIFIFITIIYCTQNNIQTIVTGSHLDDRISPDNSDYYYKCLQDFLEELRGFRGIVVKPILYEIGGKSAVINLGIDMGVNFNYCWTCHNSSKRIDNIYHQCGECSDCRTRYAAFQKINKEDPIPYLKTPNL